MAIFTEPTENECINERHPLSKAIFWPIRHENRKTVRDTMYVGIYSLTGSRIRLSIGTNVNYLEWPWTAKRLPTRAISAVAELLLVLMWRYSSLVVGYWTVYERTCIMLNIICHTSRWS